MAITYALAHAPSSDLVVDIVQASYIEFIGEAAMDDEPDELRTKLRRIVRRVAQREWNERYRKAPERMAKIALYLSAITASHLEDKVFGDELEKLNGCLGELTERNRNLIEEHYFQGRSVVEISKERNVTPRSVFKAISRIRDGLRNCIEHGKHEKNHD